LLPVTDTWHGDLTPWNCGRDGDGRLWIWDWEDADRDALAGLDSLHWCIASARVTGGSTGLIDLDAGLRAATPHLTALGIPPQHRGTVAGAYVLGVLDRACTLARTAGSWDDALVQPAGLLDLLSQAARLAEGQGDR
jgi:hypothetical protein